MRLEELTLRPLICRLAIRNCNQYLLYLFFFLSKRWRQQISTFRSVHDIYMTPPQPLFWHEIFYVFQNFFLFSLIFSSFSYFWNLHFLPFLQQRFSWCRSLVPDQFKERKVMSKSPPRAVKWGAVSLLCNCCGSCVC